MQKGRLAKDATPQQRLNVAECSRRIDPPKLPEVPPRPSSADPRQPPFSSPSLSRRSIPPPHPPAGVSNAPHKRPALGSGGFLPPNLMNELNSVLTKSGRSAAARSAEGEERL